MCSCTCRLVYFIGALNGAVQGCIQSNLQNQPESIAGARGKTGLNAEKQHASGKGHETGSGDGTGIKDDS